MSYKLYRLALWQGYKLFLHAVLHTKPRKHTRRGALQCSLSSQTALIQKELDLRLGILPEIHVSFLVSISISMTFELCICSSVLFKGNASASSIWREREVHCQTRVGFKSCWASWDLCAFSCRLFWLMKVYAGYSTMVPLVRPLDVVYHTDNK